jgi:WD40 repeat protein
METEMKKMTIFILALLAMLAPPLWGQDSDTVWTIMTFPVQCGGTKFTPDGHSVIVAYGNKIHEYDAQSSELMRVFSGNKSTIRSGQLEVSPICGKVVACDEKGFVMVWDYITGKLDTVLNYIIEIYEGATCIAISPDDKYIFIGLNGMPDDYYSNTVIYDIEMNNEVSRIKNNGRTRELAISNDGKYLAIGSIEQSQPNADIYGRVTLWDAETLEPIKELSYSKGEIQDLDFSPDNSMLAVAQWDGTVRIWNVSTLVPIHTISCFNSNLVYTVKYSQDSKYIITYATGTPDNTYSEIWDIDNKLSIYKYPYSFHMGVDVSTDNKYLCGGHGGMIYLLHARWEPSGFIEMDNDKNILYPNPTDGLLSFSINIPNPSNLKVYIYNEAGVKIVENNYGFIDSGQQEITIETAMLSEGIYFIKAFAGENNYKFKFVVSR